MIEGGGVVFTATSLVGVWVLLGGVETVRVVLVLVEPAVLVVVVVVAVLVPSVPGFL